MNEKIELTQENLARFLETGAAFSSISFDLTNYDFHDVFYVREVTVHCDTCNKPKPYHNINSRQAERHKYMGYLNSSADFYELMNGSTQTLTFKCITCLSELQNYLLDFEIEEDEITFTKSGESPRRRKPASKSLTNFFKQDKDEYLKAEVCLSHGYGVAAFVYMRRIIERNVNHLLKLIVENEEKDSKVAKKIQELNEATPMSDKIKLANLELPSYLKFDGLNPLGTMYGILSDGVHSLSDEKCLAKAKELQACLDFVVGELSHHKKNKALLKQRINALKKD